MVLRRVHRFELARSGRQLTEGTAAEKLCPFPSRPESDLRCPQPREIEGVYALRRRMPSRMCQMNFEQRGDLGSLQIVDANQHGSLPLARAHRLRCAPLRPVPAWRTPRPDPVVMGDDLLGGDDGRLPGRVRIETGVTW